MAHKRNASAAELNERNAKLDAALVASGRAPPSGLLNGVTSADFVGHEGAWAEMLKQLEADIKPLRKAVSKSKRETFLRSERDAFDCPCVDIGATLADVTQLVWVENDHPDELWESGDYEDTCVCCNRMEESWRHMDRYGYDIEPRWRIIGSSKFVCRWCYDQLSAGKTCKIML